MRVRGFLLDVEGTLVGDKRYQAIPGAAEFVQEVRAAGAAVRLITNNTTDNKPTILDKLTAAGFEFTIDELHTCVGVAITYLRQARAKACLVLGSVALRKMFTDEGFELVEEGKVDAVIVGLDTDLTYDRLCAACEAVARGGATLIALHRNRVFGDSRGRRAPSVGAIVEAIHYATQVEPIVIGKPSPAYFQQALDAMALPTESVMVVSDDPLSDLAGARRMGMKAGFVLSGKYGDRSVLDALPPAELPDVTVEVIGDLLTTGVVEI